MHNSSSNLLYCRSSRKDLLKQLRIRKSPGQIGLIAPTREFTLVKLLRNQASCKLARKLPIRQEHMKRPFAMTCKYVLAFVYPELDCCVQCFEHRRSAKIVQKRLNAQTGCGDKQEVGMKTMLPPFLRNAANCHVSVLDHETRSKLFSKRLCGLGGKV